MKAFVAVFASVAAVASGAVVPAAVPEAVAIPAPVVPASTLVRAPAHDSATIESHRLGGNFAYATAEAHAFAKVTPQLATRTIPVAETTHIHTPAAIKTVQPAPIVTTKHVAQPILKQEPVFRQEAVIGPVATHTTYEQPLFKTRTYTHTGVAHHTVAAPVATHVAYQPAPVAAVEAIEAAPLEALPVVAYTGTPAALAHGPIAYGHGPATFAHGPAVLAHGPIVAPVPATDAAAAPAAAPADVADKE